MRKNGPQRYLKRVREIYRDESLLVIDKLAGLPMHPSARYHRGTLVALLAQRYPDSEFSPVHRLDRETSGLVVCARGTEVPRSLMRAFLNRAVHKEYLAICEGSPEQDLFEIDAPIAEGRPLVRIAVRIDTAIRKPARTEFSVLRRFSQDGSHFALIRALSANRTTASDSRPP